MKTKGKGPTTRATSGIEERVRSLVAGDFLVGPAEVLPVEQTRALWTKPAGETTRFHELFGKFCSSSTILDVCGKATVGDDGTVEFKLTDLVCLRGPAAGANFNRITPPAFVVATARSDSPVHLTTQVRVQDDDVLVKILAWDASGTPVPEASVDWRCCVRLLEVIG